MPVTFKNRNEIRELVEDRPDKAAEEFYRTSNQLRTADDLLKKLGDLSKFTDRDDYRKAALDIRDRLANYMDWYHNDERFDDRH